MIDYDLYRDVLNVKGSIEKFLTDRHEGLKRAIMIKTTICVNCRLHLFKQNKTCDNCETQKKREKIIEKINELENFMKNNVRDL